MSKIGFIMAKEMQRPWKHGQTFNPHSRGIFIKLKRIKPQFRGYLWCGQMPAIERVPEIGRMTFFLMCREILIFHSFFWQFHGNNCQCSDRTNLKRILLISKNICRKFSHQYVFIHPGQKNYKARQVHS